MLKLNVLMASLRQRAQDVLDHSEPNMPALGYYAAVSFLLWAVVLAWMIPQPYENLGFRVLESVLALPLIFYRLLPGFLRKPFPFYFLFYTLFSCPFFFFFMTMKNEWSQVWTTTALGGLMVIIVITYDWLFITLLMTLAYLAAYVFVMLQDGVIRYTHLDWTYMISFVFSVSGMMVATRWMRSSQELRFTILKSLGGTIAHEMRNALNAVALSIESVRGLLPLKPTDAAEGRHDTAIPDASLSRIYDTIDVGAETIQQADKVIESILSSFTGKKIDQSQFRQLTASGAIRSALDGYGFSSAEERSFVNVDDSFDFDFLGDQDLLSNLLTNLLNNALYYRYVDGFRIDISTRTLATGNRIIFRDSGPGIDPERLERIFQPFYTYGKPGGNGIGLAYCRRIVSAFSGRIACRSEVGKWTEFVIDLPAYNTKAVEFLKYEILGDKKVLIVDDQPANRILLRKILSDMNCACDQAVNGLVAIEMARKTRYDLILMDIEMPELNGDEAVHRLRHGIGIERSLAQHYLDVPIVGITALPEEEGRRRALGSGMDECLFKPVRKQEIAPVVEKYFFSERKVRSTGPTDLRMEGNILIVEDNMASREFLKAMLESIGFRVSQAENGKRALEMLETVTPDLIIMDMEMPVMDGIEASRIIRAGGSARLMQLRQVPIVMLSGYSEKEAVIASRETYINCHLGKPVWKQDLVKAVSDLLYQSEVQRQTEAPDDTPASSTWTEVERVEILEPSTIESLRELGDEEFMENLFRLFIDETSRIIDDLEDACGKQDWVRAIRANHTMKGSAANIGATRILSMTTRISKALHDGRCPAEDDWAYYLRNVCRQTGEALSTLACIKPVT
jgi:two-component system CAI-1 autoinducer sensor kinase/phosphatase CqsS